MDEPPLPHSDPDPGPTTSVGRSTPDDAAPASEVIDAALAEVLTESRSLGFLGPGPVEAHIRHARAMLPAVQGARRLLDLGSGGGLPGLVLASHLDLEVVLLDASLRRCEFLRRAVERLDLPARTSVQCGRAEELARDVELRHRFDLVVARSFGSPAVTAECAAAFLDGPGSRVLVSEPPGGEPGRWDEDGLGSLGLRRGTPMVTPRATVQELVAFERCGDGVPRRVGIPAKRPLF